ncbi:MAG: CHAT domain-containing protein [Terriglobales bacterium]
MGRRAVLLLLLFAFAAVGRGGCESAVQLVRRGAAMLATRDYAHAQAVLERAAALAANGRQAATLAEAHLWLGILLGDRDQIRQARATLEQSRAEYQALKDEAGAGRADLALGNVIYQTDAADAHRLWLAALAAFTAHHATAYEARVLWSLSFDYTVSAEQRLTWIRKGLPLAQAADRNDPKSKVVEGGLWEQYGDQLYSCGNYAGAIDKLERAIVCFTAAGDPFQLARGYSSLGQLYGGHGDVAQSRALFARALRLQRRVHDRDGILQSRNAIAEADLELGHKVKALDESRQLLAWARDFASPLALGVLQGNLGTAYLRNGDLHAAQTYLREALAHLSRSRSRYLIDLAEADFRLGQLNASLQAAREAQLAAEQEHSRARLYSALFWRSRAEERKGESEAALADTDRALTALDDLRAHLIPTDRMKSDFIAMTREVYDYAVSLNASHARARRALEISEGARARAFADLLASRGVELPEPSRQAVAAALDAERHVARVAPASGLTLPSGANATPLSEETAAAMATQLNVTVLCYWSSPGETWVFVLTPAGQLHAARAPATRAELVRLIAAATAPLQETELRAAATSTPRQKALARLDRVLLGPARRYLPPTGALLIVPDGPLFGLSFAALPEPDGSYLLEHHTLSYAPSLTSLHLTQQRARPGRSRLLLVADPRLPVLPGVGSLPPLPGARREVEAVARLVGPGEATVMAGSEAARTAVLRQMAAPYSVVHLATHALVRDADPLDSFIALGGSRASGAELTAAQIYHLKLHADLVFLSACRGAAGPVTGDGRTGLTRAFFYAGTPSVIASLWDVADAPTSYLVTEFYRHYLRGQGKAASLRAAQLALLRELRAGRLRAATTMGGSVALPANPIFWAGFILAGQP